MSPEHQQQPYDTDYQLLFGVFLLGEFQFTRDPFPFRLFHRNSNSRVFFSSHKYLLLCHLRKHIRQGGILMRVKLKFPSILNLNRKTVMLISRFSYPESRCPTRTRSKNPEWSLFNVPFNMPKWSSTSPEMHRNAAQLTHVPMKDALYKKYICEFGKRNSLHTTTACPRHQAWSVNRLRSPIVTWRRCLWRIVLLGQCDHNKMKHNIGLVVPCLRVAS